MSGPWIPRLLLTLLGVQVGLCTAFLVDEWSPLTLREETAFRRIIAPSNEQGHIIEHGPSQDRSLIARPIKDGTPSSYLHVNIRENEEHPNDQFPRDSNDWSLLLKSASTTAPGIAAIDHPLTWKNESDLLLLNLDEQLSLYKSAVLCVDLRRDPVGQTLPNFLKRSAIPRSNVTGNIALLPLVNRLVFPPSVTGTDHILFGFRQIESAESHDKMFTFARWDDFLIPSFPLALAMAQHGVNPADVHVSLGSHVRLGNGPIIPLDEFGHISLPQDDNQHIILPPSAQRSVAFSTAEGVVDGELSASLLPGQTPSTTLFTDSTGQATSPWGNSRTLLNIANAIDILPRPGPAEIHSRFPLWLETFILIMLAALGAACLSLGPLARNLAFPLLILSGLALAAALLRFQGSWTPLTPILTCTLATWALSTLIPTFQTPPDNYPQP